jgi:hypothetical protein|uniref:Uncharacterized protein n=1 Tax=viral metagenome TaxID=1070528 RepID=A0A6C0CWS5_9ZZZZ
MNFYWKIHNFILRYFVFICIYIEEHKLDMPLEDIMQSEN